MEQSTDSMSVMARDLCRALGIDVDKLFDVVKDQETSIQLEKGAGSHTPSEMASS
jgi:hypothetical protein